MIAVPRKSILIPVLIVLLAMAGGTGWILYKEFGHLLEVSAMRAHALSALTTVPAPVYFAAFVVLPSFFVPLTLFYLTALPILGAQNPTLGIALAWAALLLNITFSRFLANGVLRPGIERLLARKNRVLPTWRRDTEWQTVLAVRLSPVPFCVQNYLLALGKASWRTYLWMSWPIQCAIGLGMMLVGESLLKGGLGYAMSAICLLILLHLGVQRLRRKLPTVELDDA